MMPILVKRDDVISGTKVNANHGKRVVNRLRA